VNKQILQSKLEVSCSKYSHSFSCCRMACASKNK